MRGNAQPDGRPLVRKTSKFCDKVLALHLEALADTWFSSMIIYKFSAENNKAIYNLSHVIV